MITYAYKNGGKNTDSIKQKILSLYNTEVMYEKDDEISIGNEQVLFCIEREMTSILLLDDSTNVREMTRYFRGK